MSVDNSSKSKGGGGGESGGSGAGGASSSGVWRGDKRPAYDTSLNESMVVDNQQAKTSRTEKIAPILVYSICDPQVKDYSAKRKRVSDEIEKCKNISIQHLQITTNNNLLIFVDDEKHKQVILNNDSFFPNSKKLDLGAREARPFVLLKGISFDELANSNFDLKQIGVEDSSPVLNKENKQLNIVKLFVKDAAAKATLVARKTIKIGLFNFSVEDPRGGIIQCRNCKKFGHSESKCRGKYVCPTCGEQHDSNAACSSNQKKCANCGNDHSAFYKGCSAFQKAKTSKKSNPPVGATTSSSSSFSKTSASTNEFHRNYSAAVDSKYAQAPLLEIATKLEKKLNLLDEIQSSVDVLTDHVEDMQTTLESIEKDLTRMGGKVFYFVLDAIRIILPNIEKPNPESVNTLLAAFNHHKLGTISIEEANGYVDKMFRKIANPHTNRTGSGANRNNKNNSNAN
jgi:hypothetical protein